MIQGCLPAATSSRVGASDFLIRDTFPSVIVASLRRSMTRVAVYWSYATMKVCIVPFDSKAEMLVMSSKIHQAFTAPGYQGT